MDNSTEIWTLSNGISVISQYQKNSLVVQTGIIINVGTRDETVPQSGIAHLFEHMAFKGTQKRKPWHILNAIDSIGGEVNAFTTREKTCFHTITTKQYLKKSLDLLSDIVFFSNFPEKELLKEKQVIYEEMDMYADLPEESIYDEFENSIFPDQTLGLPILGTRESLEPINAQDLLRFRNQLYTTHNLVFSIVGNFRKDLLEAYCKNFLEPISLPRHKISRPQPTIAQPFHKVIQKPTHQGHYILGGEACDYHSENFYAFSLLVHYLGGETMNNLLNLNIREKYGLCYHISSFYVPYQDTGIWGIYVGFDFNNFKKLEKLIHKELKNFIENGVTPTKLERIKKQFIGHLILSNESRFNRMQSQAKNWLDYGRLIGMKEVIEKIKQINIEKIHQVSNQYLLPEKLSSILYKPMK